MYSASCAVCRAYCTLYGVRLWETHGTCVRLAVTEEMVATPALEDMRLEAVKPSGDKVKRSGAWAGRVEDGLFHVLRSEWAQPFLDEYSAFPIGKHDDQVDAVSGVVQMLAAFQKPASVTVDVPADCFKSARDGGRLGIHRGRHGQGRLRPR